MSEKDKLIELEDEELKQVSGGVLDPNDPYCGYPPEKFGNFQVGDRVKEYNLMGTYKWHYGTVMGFAVRTSYTPMGGGGRTFVVRVLWDDIGTNKTDGTFDCFPSNLTKA